MNILFLCKASTELGLGHLIRSKTLAEGLYSLNPSYNFSFWIIGEDYINKLLQDFQLPYQLFSNEDQVIISNKYNVTYIDTLHLNNSTIHSIKANTDLIVSLSPIFNQMQFVDVLINRTDYFGDYQYKPNIKKYGGVKFSIVQKDCKKINTAFYKSGLEKKKLSIAISMGGGDAANKTLSLIKRLKHLKSPSIFWVMLGEGYKHSYDELVSEISTVKDHEIILAKTNHSMWSILSNVSLLITTSGITTYEAVYAGLPSIVFYEDSNRFFLIKELIEKEVIIDGGIYNDLSSEKLITIVEQLINKKSHLLEIHRKSKTLIDNSNISRIDKIIKTHLSKEAKV